MSDAIRILIYEDDNDLRESIVSLLSLEPKNNVVGQFAKSILVLEHLQTLNPDLILTDIGMPGMSGVELTRKVRLTNQHIPIIVLTVFEDNQNVLDAICAGASGYLLKKYIADKLIEAIQDVMTGGSPMSPSVARMVVSSMQQKKKENNEYHLTEREMQILVSLTNGNSYKLIAAEFDLSLDTVRSHIKGIYSKLQVHSQTEAVSKALKEKIVNS